MSSAPRNAICSGCKISFTYSGLTHHLAQSYDIRCIAAQQDIEDYTVVDNINGDLQQSTLKTKSQSPHFKEDYFRVDYQEEDFKWEDEED